MITATAALTLDRDGHAAVEARLHALDAKGRLDPGAAVRAIRAIRHPEALRDRLGGPLRYCADRSLPPPAARSWRRSVRTPLQMRHTLWSGRSDDAVSG